MSKGFIVLAQNTPQADYVKMAYALALSLKLSQNNDYPISLITNDQVPEEYLPVFDKIIPIPFHDPNTPTRYKTESRWKLYHVSPYEETIVLDSDMLVLRDLEIFWKIFNRYDIYFTSTVKTYRNNTVKQSPYRLAFTNNNLPNLYAGLHYFKRCDFSLKYYSCIEDISKNWKDFYKAYVAKNTPLEASMDVIVALAAIHLDCVERVSDYKNDIVNFVHMKPAIQDWKDTPISWQDSVEVNFDNNGNLIVGNYRQQSVFHYTEKSFLKDTTIRKMEKLWNLHRINNEDITQ